MPFKNSVVAAVLATATSGSRIVIDGTGAFANLIQFWTGRVAETTPAVLRHDFIAFTSLYSMSMRSAVVTPPGNTPGELTISTKETTGVTSMDLKADTVTLTTRGTTVIPRVGDVNSRFNATADTVQFNGFTTNMPKLYLDGFGLLDVLGAWQSYTPALTATVVNPTLGAGSVWRAAYMVVGHTCHARWRLICGAGWSPGSGTIAVGLPLPAKALTEFGANGPGFIVNPLAGPAEYVVNWTVNIGNTNVIAQIANAPGTYVNSGALNGVAAQISGSITYEIA